MSEVVKPQPRKLRAVAPEAAEPAKPKVLIFGKPGVGKTWWALDFPTCYYIDTEGGANLGHYTEKLRASRGMYFGPEQGSQDFRTVFEEVQTLATEDHPYKTLVIDSISHLFNSEIASEQDRMAAEKKKDEYGASKKLAVSLMRRMMNWLDRLDMNVILVAYQKDEYGTNTKGEREVIGATFDCWDRIEYILHLALHVTKVGPSRYGKVRKSRLLGFPDGEGFRWTFNEFAERYGRDVIYGSVKQVHLASPEQIAEINDLLSKVKVEPDWIEKCLKRGKADALEEMDTDKLAAMITMLKDRLK